MDWEDIRGSCAWYDLFMKYQDVGRSPRRGFYTNFLGAITRVAYIEWLLGWDGRVEEDPLSARKEVGSAAEWAGMLIAVEAAPVAIEAAPKTFTAVELGAGFGPWLVNSGLAARRKGIQSVRLIGIEGDQTHCRWMEDNLIENGFEQSEFIALHGVVGTRSGFAAFPVVNEPNADWGARPNFFSTEADCDALVEHSNSEVDYRGRVFCWAKVRTYSVEDCTSSRPSLPSGFHGSGHPRLRR